MTQPLTDLTEAIRYQCDQLGYADWTIPEIVDSVLREHPEAVAEAIRKSQRAMVTKAVKAEVAPPASQQPPLPGFENLPLRISLPAEGGGYVYRDSRVASLRDFSAHREILDEGIRADIRRRDMFAEAVEVVSDLLGKHGVSCIRDLPPDAQPQP